MILSLLEKMELMLLDSFWKVLDGMLVWVNLKKLNLKKCSVCYLSFIARLSLSQLMLKKTRAYINVHAIKLKIEEMTMFLLLN